MTAVSTAAVAKKVTMAIMDPVQGKLEVVTPAATQAAIDPWRGFYKDVENIIRPTIDPLKWLRYYEISDALAPTIDAFCALTEGTGFGVEEVTMRGSGAPLDAPEDEREDQRADTYDLLDCLCPDDLGAMRKTSKMHLMLTGFRGFEVVRNPKVKVKEDGPKRGYRSPRGQFAYLSHVSSALLRATQRDKAPRRMIWWRRDRDGNWVKGWRYKYFRRWVKIDPLSHAKVWFSEFGDPQLIDRHTGEVLTNSVGEALPGMEARTNPDSPEYSVANEIIVQTWAQDPYESPYGICPMTSIGFPVEGNIEAAGANYMAFKRGFRFPFLVLVEGGYMDEEDLERQKEKLFEHAGSERFHEPVVLNADAGKPSAGGGMGMVGAGSAGQVRIRIEKLHDVFERDHSHAEYQERNARVIGQRWRMPAVFYGRTGDEFTYATIWASLWMFENTVAPDERRRTDDIINRMLLPELGVHLWSVKTHGISMAELSEVKEVLNVLLTHGVITPDEARAIAAKAAHLDIGRLPEDLSAWAGAPLSAPGGVESSEPEARSAIRQEAARFAEAVRMRRLEPPSETERQRLGLVS